MKYYLRVPIFRCLSEIILSSLKQQIIEGIGLEGILKVHLILALMSTAKDTFH